MSAINIELYDALIAAGSPENKAKLAAETVSSQEQKLNRLDLMIVGLYVFSAAGFGYIVMLLNTIISKLT